MAGKHTIADIARLAGVSKTTVSRVLNHKPDVDPITRERILRIVKEVGFVPNLIASGLAGGHTRLLGVLIPSFASPFVAEIMHGVSEAIADTPYELLLYHLNEMAYENNKRDIIRHILVSRLTTGLLSIFPGPWAEHVVRLHTDEGYPVVMVNDQAAPPTIPWVGIDNRAGAQQAVQHLLALGHRRIAHIQGPMQYYCSQERYTGYCEALKNAGLSLDPALVAEGHFNRAGGYDAAMAFFSLPIEQRPTAIFAANDLSAYGVLDAAAKYRVNVPDDVALIGFDDEYSSVLVRPELTTIKQPFREMGRHGLNMLLSMLDSSKHSTTVMSAFAVHEQKEQSDSSLHMQLDTSLIVRASSCGVAESQTLSSL
jgi:LacI family transcriptional regulator